MQFPHLYDKFNNIIPVGNWTSLLLYLEKLSEAKLNKKMKKEKKREKHRKKELQETNLEHAKQVSSKKQGRDEEDKDCKSL